MTTKLKNQIWLVAGGIFLLLFIIAIFGQSFDGILIAAPWLIFSVFCFIQSSVKARASTCQFFGKTKTKIIELWRDKFYRWHFVSIILFLLIGLFALIGLPGALIFEANETILNLIFGENTILSLSGDSAWPVAIVITALWPWGFLIALMFTRKLKTQSLSFKRFLYFLVVFVWGLLLTWLLSK